MRIIFRMRYGKEEERTLISSLEKNLQNTLTTCSTRLANSATVLWNALQSYKTAEQTVGTDTLQLNADQYILKRGDCPCGLIKLEPAVSRTRSKRFESVDFADSVSVNNLIQSVAPER